MTGRRGEQGAAMLSFAIFLGVAILSIVTAFTASIATKQSSTLHARQELYLRALVPKIEAYYEANASLIDADLTWREFTSEKLKRDLLETPKWGAQLWISNPLSLPEGIKYRRIIVFLRTDTDDRNPPDEEQFTTTGVFVSCSDASKPCESRKTLIYEGQALQRKNYQATISKLESLAARAQSYFKSRVLQDPERNVSLDYFRPPFGNCTGIAPYDLPCTELSGTPYQALGDTTVGAQFMQVLGLEDSYTVNAWGAPVEVANSGPDVNWCRPGDCMPPFTLAIRTRTPYGGFIKVRAVQPM